MRRVAAILLAAGVVAAVAFPSTAHADEDWNWLVGPLVGVRLGGVKDGSRAIYGIEGGAGLGPERLNVGITRRLDQTFAYVELDPWYLIGGTLGFGGELESGELFPVVGVWEGIPLKYPDCAGAGLHPAVTLAGGYRWTGVHELYVTMKAGRAPDFCWD
ncbi:MAG TPA: hypothetical protein VM261_03290 [Kofleriaceae bacterium]|nr:hypothetical protein [Kofleriaceae bacterium]